MFEKTVVIDARGHLLGRLASVVAKELLSGQRVVVVRAEEMEQSKSIYANALKFKDFRAKRTATNPRRGPFHETSPAQMVRRVIRGMLPRKTRRGENALDLLRVYEGVPTPYDKMKRMVVPDALRVLRLRPGRRFTNIGKLCSTLGWKQAAVVKALEDKRKAKSAAYFEAKKAAVKAKAKAQAEVPADAVLKQFGYA